MSALLLSPEQEKRLAVSYGLSDAEYTAMAGLMKRGLTAGEVAVFSAMWNEHCSYKSSRTWLARLPTQGAQVICGPGENAGVVDIGDGMAAVFKIESHNHPSFIEPYQGASTGVGGIMRDVFTMGARPVANLNALYFGDCNHAKTHHLVSGVVAGIGDYGNCMGVPTVGGSCGFDAGYNGNILVNAMCVGLARKDAIFTAKATGAGNTVLYVGAKTGRDGIHGASMASASFDTQTQDKRPTVQIGDPFAQKCLLEACLELMQKNVVVAVQDMGAAGLTSSSVEMASSGGLGIELLLDKVPCRAAGMTPEEIMLSESQERMLMIIPPDGEKVALEIFSRWNLDAVPMGTLTKSGRLVAHHHGKCVVDIPLPYLTDDAPLYDRPRQKIPPRVGKAVDDIVVKDVSPTQVLRRLFHSPYLSSRRWIWEQYDRTVMGDTVQASGQKGGLDAAVVRVHESSKGLAMTVDSTPRYVQENAYEGGKQAVCEAWRNLIAVGAQPLAITNCLNFGAPDNPRVMEQFAQCVEGMRAACLALNFPVVSGNVSFYNTTGTASVPPTPVIGGVGLVADVGKVMTCDFKAQGEAIFCLGQSHGHLGSSIYARVMHPKAEEYAHAPTVNLDMENRHGAFVMDMIAKAIVTSVHDVAHGGLAAAVAEMALMGSMGAELGGDASFLPAHGLPVHGLWFGEDQGRYVLTAPPAKVAALQNAALKAGVHLDRIGTTGGACVTIHHEDSRDSLCLKELRQGYESWFPNFMDAPHLMNKHD